MIVLPDDRFWTDDEIAAFHDEVQSWTHREIIRFYSGLVPSKNKFTESNFLRFHKCYKARIAHVTKNTPIQILQAERA